MLPVLHAAALYGSRRPWRRNFCATRRAIPKPEWGSFYLVCVCVVGLCAGVSFRFRRSMTASVPMCARKLCRAHCAHALIYKALFLWHKASSVRRAEQRQMTKCDCYFCPAQYPTDVRNTKRLATSTTDINETPTNQRTSEACNSQPPSCLVCDDLRGQISWRLRVMRLFIRRP